MTSLRRRRVGGEVEFKSSLPIRRRPKKGVRRAGGGRFDTAVVDAKKCRAQNQSKHTPIHEYFAPEGPPRVWRVRGQALQKQSLGPTIQSPRLHTAIGPARQQSRGVGRHEHDEPDGILVSALRPPQKIYQIWRDLCNGERWLEVAKTREGRIVGVVRLSV